MNSLPSSAVWRGLKLRSAASPVLAVSLITAPVFVFAVVAKQVYEDELVDDIETDSKYSGKKPNNRGGAGTRPMHRQGSLGNLSSRSSGGSSFSLYAIMHHCRPGESHDVCTRKLIALSLWVAEPWCCRRLSARAVSSLCRWRS
eukprot:scaffold4993_cov211-Prasinococcus_capsulatus_cf.AAC.4